MRDLNDLHFFVAVLEEQLGLRLLERSTRRLSVTEVGRDVYRHARAVVDEAETIDEVALRMKSQPQGLVRISCPTGVQSGLTGSLPGFLGRYPLLRVQFVVTNRPVDLIGESIDIAIRIRERLDTDGDLQMRRIGISRRILVASRGLVRKYGTPEQPDDLQRFPVIHA